MSGQRAFAAIVRAMEPASVTDLGTILSIWAHPDDETYLAGGVMAAAAANGQRVVCVSLTAGERGTADPEHWPPDRLGHVRRLEAAVAMAVLGVPEHHVFGLPDGDLPRREEDGRKLVAQLLDAVRPDTILTFGPDGATFHPDHLAVHRWVGDAWRARSTPARLLHATSTTDHLGRFGGLYHELGVYMDERRPTGVPSDRLAVRLRLAGDALDRKIAALRAMATQTAALVDAVGIDVYAALICEEAFVDAGR